MAANSVVNGNRMKIVCSMAVGVAAMSMASRAAADDAPRMVGGHIGVATPLVTISKKTTSISDQFTLLTPIGISVHTSRHVVVDFETVVANPISPVGTTGLIVDPGIVYDWGGVATGLRLAFQTNANANFGLIPLVNVGLANLGSSTWFIEAAFPTFFQSKLDDPPATGHHLGVDFNVVLHTGIGF